mgnify:CR=1 FL=1
MGMALSLGEKGARDQAAMALVYPARRMMLRLLGCAFSRSTARRSTRSCSAGSPSRVAARYWRPNRSRSCAADADSGTGSTTHLSVERLKLLPDLVLSDFGTRRRHGFLWQRWCIQALKEGLGKSFIGTSNVLHAMENDLEAIGTNGHELPMVLAALAPDVDAGLRDMRGPNAFFTAWGLSDPDSAVYGVLTQILSMPGVRSGEQFCGPYVGVQFPADLDRSKHQVVLNPNLKVREDKSATSKVVATISYEIVQVLDRGAEWTKVRLQSGVEGYIQIAYLYSPAGYRACFSKSPEGAWHLQSLAAPR